MTREFSAYLNLLRLGAALIVFLGHCAWLWTPGYFGFFMTHGWIVPVLVFFVLSGFVIGHTVEHKERSAADYAVNRAARIYSVALPALVATFALDAVGRHVAPTLYSTSWGYTAVHPTKQFVRSLLFVNEIWWSRSMPGSNGPFWSLAYEVWYYVGFGILVFGRGWLRFPAAVLVLTLAGPWVATLFPIWLLGVGTSRLAGHSLVNSHGGWLLAIGGLMLVVAVEAWATQAGLRHPPHPIFMHREEVGLDYLIAIGIAMHLFGMHTIASAFGPILRPVARPIGWLAGATFTLYLFHFPVAQCLAAINPWPSQSLASRLMVIGGTLIIVLMLAELTERRKEPWRRLFTTLLQHGAVTVAHLRQSRPS